MSVVHLRRTYSKKRQRLLRKYSAAKKEFRDAAKTHAERVKARLDDVVSDWKNRPDFIIEVKLSKREIETVVRLRKNRIASRIFRYVDEGTEGPYPIPKVPKTNDSRPPFLAYRQGYQPKTLPIAQAHVGPGTAEGPLVFARQVMHPGIEARNFTATIQEETYPEFRRDMENLFRRLTRR